MREKYIFFCGTLEHGGAERVISVLSERMSSCGLDITILLYYNRNIFYKIDNNVKIISVEKELSLKGKKGVYNSLKWMRQYFRENADCIISFLAPFNIIALLAHMNLDCKIIVADRNDPKYIPDNKIIRFIRDKLYCFADGVVMQTEKNKSYFNNKIQNKAIVIYNPVNNDISVKREYNVPKYKRIVAAGRLNSQKNHEMLIKAFSKFSKIHSEYDLVIYGDGPLEKWLIKRSIQLGIRDKVNFPGSVNNLYEKMLEAEIFVLSSNYEGMPNVLIEAMCLGLPVISTKVSGATDLIQDGINGILIDIDSDDELVRKLCELVESPEKEKSISIKAAELKSLLCVEKIVEQWVNYINSV